MTYLLDTDTLNYIIRQQPGTYTRFRQALLNGHSFVLSAFVHFEMTRYHKLKGERRLTRLYESVVLRWPIVGFDEEDWDTAADLWAERHRRGRPIEDSDLLIAVSALKAGATLVTNNTSHFEGLGLDMENWAAP